MKKEGTLIVLATIVLLTFIVSETHAGSIAFRSGGGPEIRKQVTSIREARYKRVEAQKLDFSCGAASLATILKYQYGKEISEEEIVLEMLTGGNRDVIKEKGFSLLDIKKYAEKIEYQADGYRIEPEYLRDLPPSIMLITTGGYSHFVVFKGVVKDEVYLADPASGNRIMELDNFLNVWNNIVLIIDGPKTGDPEGFYLGTTNAPGADAMRTKKISLGFFKNPKEF